METKKNLDVKMKSKEEIFTDIIAEKDNVIHELKSTLVMLKDKISRQRDENTVYEEIINRYRLKMERLGDFEVTLTKGYFLQYSANAEPRSSEVTFEDGSAYTFERIPLDIGTTWGIKKSL